MKRETWRVGVRPWLGVALGVGMVFFPVETNMIRGSKIYHMYIFVYILKIHIVIKQNQDRYSNMNSNFALRSYHSWNFYTT